MSADTIIPGYSNPQNLNRYSYVANDPLRYTDPTGHRACEDYGGSCLPERQITRRYQADLQAQRNRSRNRLERVELSSQPNINVPVSGNSTPYINVQASGYNLPAGLTPVSGGLSL